MRFPVGSLVVLVSAALALAAPIISSHSPDSIHVNDHLYKRTDPNLAQSSTVCDSMNTVEVLSSDQYPVFICKTQWVWG